MNKVYIQSRLQNLFYRLYNSASQVFWLVCAATIIPLFTDRYLSNLSVTISILIGLAIIYTVWLNIFNSGKNNLVEHGVKISDKGISYLHYGTSKTISWANFKGYSVKGIFPRLVLLSGSDGEVIYFQYYAFSSKQRNEIFDHLKSKENR